MKRVVLSIMVLFICILINAQAPESFSYQAIVRNTAGQPLVIQDVIFLFSIIKTTTGGTVVYTEKHAVETNQFGLVTLAIGNGTDKTGDFTTIDWGADTYFLNVQLDKGDAIFMDMGTTQLLSVPYALHAKIAETITAHYIGESYGGGKVFYVYDNGQHGLIAATADQSTGIRWNAGTYTNTMAQANGVGAGKANTTIIIANQGYGDGATYAARICDEYSVIVDGVTYGDWYLPSKYELNLLYLQKNVVGGFATDNYWSSTEYNTNVAGKQNFTNGSQTYITKDNTYYVRAVRSF
jgi:hypothetical protein